ncbi:MAG TPA: LytTR family DNA-binding domain-containing protein, partial [Pyrinomonadaceae bacterium]|nr:LytTR family DNA-binding domain-containing protein [Pyrinomonadaceae bacterium]
VGEAENLAGAIELIETEKPDVVFLDIQLSSAGENGFDLLEKIERRPKVIFVTAFDAFAIRAFEVNAIDYLLKPVNPERLAKAIERLSLNPSEETGVKSDRRPLEFDDRIFLEIGARSAFLKVRDISHIDAAGDYSEVFTIDKRKFLIEKPLREWERRLPEKHFLRIHRRTIVNLEEIEHIESWFNRTFQIRLKNYRENFSVSRRYSVKLKNRFN